MSSLVWMSSPTETAASHSQSILKANSAWLSKKEWQLSKNCDEDIERRADTRRIVDGGIEAQDCDMLVYQNRQMKQTMPEDDIFRNNQKLCR